MKVNNALKFSIAFKTENTFNSFSNHYYRLYKLIFITRVRNACFYVFFLYLFLIAKREFFVYRLDSTNKI